MQLIEMVSAAVAAASSGASAWAADCGTGTLCGIAVATAAVLLSACLLLDLRLRDLWDNIARPTAYPGGPRKRRMYRSPRWTPGRRFPLEAGWRYVEGWESHKASEDRLADHIGEVRITGEGAGRQTWQFMPEVAASDKGEESLVFDASRNPNSADLPYRRQQLSRTSTQRLHESNGEKHVSGGSGGPVADAASRAAAFYETLQCDDGHWGGDYGGPMFLMPGLVVAAYVTGKLDAILPGPHRRAMVQYLRNHQQEDGGWGTHIESPSTMFGSTLSYMTMRLLGVPADDAALVAARAFMKGHGGATHTSSWAKFWLAVLGVYDWRGVNSIPPEMWLLPRWFPFHPGKLWCHCRMVYLPMCYIYGRRFVYPGAEDGTDSLVGALRRELYNQDYDSIRWDSMRFTVADIDNYSPVGRVMRVASYALSWYEWMGACQPLRRRGLEFAKNYMHAEDKQTNYVDIGPVNKVMNMLCAWVAAGADNEAARSHEFRSHMLRVDDYLWVAEDGMKMSGYNGSQCWDTSFAARALAEANLTEAFPGMAERAWGYLERTQILSTEVSKSTKANAYEEPQGRFECFRHVSRGGWPFSTSAHGWPISDCTAEGLKAVLALRSCPNIRRGVEGRRLLGISDQRLFDAANVLLSYQNHDGGWATYENTRGYGWYEWLNPSEVFGDIMIDYSYVECSSASMCALSDFRKAFPDHRREEIDAAISRGCDFIRSIQRPDGSWYGSWACCFTYGTWFGVEALVHAGVDVQRSAAVRRACEFLLKHQNANGGWGEDFTSCYDKAYALHGAKEYGTGGSSVINTAWAMLTLVAADSDAYLNALERGAQFLCEQQRDNGDWRQEGIAGVFNRACGITYTQYRNVFPMWALGRFLNWKQEKNND